MTGRAAALALLAASLAACGRSREAPPPAAGTTAAPPPIAGEPTVAGVEAALLARLEAKDLSVKWVACADEGATFEDRPVLRCNVSFGDPHIEGYCATVRDGVLVTHVEEPALRCARERTPEGEPVG